VRLDRILDQGIVSGIYRGTLRRSTNKASVPEMRGEVVKKKGRSQKAEVENQGKMHMLNGIPGSVREP
jgi:hypothetical protein